MNTIMDIEKLVIYDFSNLNYQENSKGNCFGCDSCDSCDSCDCDSESYSCDMCDSCDHGW